MANKQFESSYSKFYDLLYQDKPYKEEAKFIKDLIKNTYGDSKDISILDLACGTGKHLYELSKLGFDNLNGSDISSSMIEEAERRFEQNSVDAKFYSYSFQDANKINGNYDVVTAMFSAVNYLTTFKDQLKTFKNIYDLLKPGGIYLFDFWNGNAVVEYYSPVRYLRKGGSNHEILRISSTTLNKVEQSAEVNFDCFLINKEKIELQFNEVHHLHYYFFSEMRNLLETTGFKIVNTVPFMAPEKPLEADEWNITIVAQKV